MKQTAEPRRAFLEIGGSPPPPRSPKASENTARDIVDDIVTRGLRHGDGLPSESVMLQQYGVSRETLREALRLLEVQGLIVIRRGAGGGPAVGVVDPANLGRMAALYYHLAGGTYAELFAAWVASEPILAELAANNPDRPKVESAMRPYLAEHAPADESLRQFVTRHGEFHAVVAALARNKVLQLSVMAMGSIITRHVISNADPRDAQATIEHDHGTIARAIVRGHRRRAGALMREHIEAITSLYTDVLGPQMHNYIAWR